MENYQKEIEKEKYEIIKKCNEGLEKAIEKEDSAMVAAIAEILNKY